MSKVGVKPLFEKSSGSGFSELRQQLASDLQSIEAELQRLELWSSERPSAEALSSCEPFCLDTLSFPQWLQFIFIVRLRFMLDENLPLPNNCQIAPFGEEYFRVQVLESDTLVSCLKSVDTRLGVA